MAVLTVTTLKVVNLGDAVFVNLGDAVTPPGGLPLLLHGDTLTLTVPPLETEALKQELATAYPDLVPVDSERAVAWRQENERVAAAAVQQAVEREAKAKAWLEAHDVPAYVLEYLWDRAPGY